MAISDLSIEPFRGDYENLERMAFASWRDEYGLASFPNLYQPAYCKFLFEPVADKRNLIAAYHGDEIVSFFGNLPRTYHYAGRNYRGALSCLLVTRKEYLRQGLAVRIIAEALKWNRELKYDFALLYLEPGHRSSVMMEKLREAGHPVEWVKRMHVLGRVLDLKRVAESEGLKWWERAVIRLVKADAQPRGGSKNLVSPLPAEGEGKGEGGQGRREGARPYQAADLDSCLELLNQYQDQVPLARVWTREELAWELDYPEISQTLVYEKAGKVMGLINWTYHEHVGKTTERWAWINHVAYPDLSAPERRAFIQALLAYVQNAGAIGALEWTKKYYPLAPLYRSHFFPYFRSVNMISWNFAPGLVIKNLPRVYEVQI